ncbi:trans-sulfuration enzyme family protein [Actinomadura sp. HBU206391]|uniref:trans-sulfuration enzyme family protein n=1 Tax=Actinomadura sp. HBU206391 TaxID=2731692 RepID=UPI001C9BF34C|nr:aminotransferase class I/II-fold pyridoxal phosphate-dependent enzyme [Actinomadura sp. HBU206391]
MMLETLLVHADADDGESAIVPPIYQSVPFSAASAEEFAKVSTTPRAERFYRRYGNPTQARLEAVMATIEGAEAGLATASGMGAVSTTVLSLVAGGDHVVAQRSMYGGTLSFLQEVAPRLGIEVTLVDQTDTRAFERAVRPNTKLIMLETPSNPLLQITDVEAVTGIARDHGILTFADNTVATPVNHRPLDQGVDLVMHSITKSVSGHSDVLAGIVLGRSDLIDRIWQTHTLIGAVISPHDAWLALRGLRTLAMRVEHQNRTALALARFLDDHPAVAKVNYPGLAGHPQHDVAKRQMRGHGGLLSFELRGGYDTAERFIAALGVPARSPSLGGVRSLVVQPAAMWEHELTEEQLSEAGVPPALVRFAVGLEAETDLIADLERGLTAASSAR